ncbi:hypothetical protein HDU80_011371 [Chytriomyces hyalinus]|nr:hypothetical protein HDU80_011371 [Chytriomyces hyalinus]
MAHFDALLADIDLSVEALLAGACDVTNEKPPRLSDFTSSACNVISGYLNYLVTDTDDGNEPAVFSRRFFVQFAGRLYMFSAADPSSIPLDVFNLQHPACVKLKPTPGIAHAFEVVGLTSSGQVKSWILAANNRPLRKIWIEAISSKFKSGSSLMTEILELQQELELSKDGFNLIGQRDQSITISTSSPVPELYLKSSMGSMSPSSITDSPTSSYHSSPSEHGSHTFKSATTTAPMYSFLQDPAPVTSSSLRYSQSLRASTQQPQERRRRSTVRSSTAAIHPQQQQQQQQEYDLDFEYQTIKPQHWPKHDTTESIVSRESSWTVNLKRAGSRKNGKSISDNLSSAGLM